MSQPMMPQQQLPPQNQPQPHPQQQQQQQQQHATPPPSDLVSHVRSLVYELKKCLSNLMSCTASNIIHNSQIDTGAKTSELKATRFDKSLEEFFSLCNQIERHLVSSTRELPSPLTDFIIIFFPLFFPQLPPLFDSPGFNHPTNLAMHCSISPAASHFRVRHPISRFQQTSTVQCVTSPGHHGTC